jgi:hypothetical protein
MTETPGHVGSQGGSSEEAPSGGQKSKGRRYPSADVKALFAKTAGYCSFPHCSERCIEDSTALDGVAVFAKIAHIVAHSNVGPRADPSMSLDARDCYKNWILLCPKHHDIIDVQQNTYTVADLRRWKEEHENRIAVLLAQRIVKIGFAELSVVTKALLSTASASTTDFSVTPPQDKMDRNSLSAGTANHLRLALAKAKEVREFIQNVSTLDMKFPERLRAGLLAEYDRLRKEGITGDPLFESMVVFASSGSLSLPDQAAGLAVLGYFFEICEIFER